MERLRPFGVSQSVRTARFDRLHVLFADLALQDMADQCAALNKQKVQLQREFDAFKDLTAQVGTGRRGVLVFVCISSGLWAPGSTCPVACMTHSAVGGLMNLSPVGMACTLWSG